MFEINKNGIIRTDWQWMIRLAWGKRRVSSRAEDGTKAYPEGVTASWRMWADWIVRNWNNKETSVVVTAKGADHGADYAQEIAARAEAERVEAIRSTMTQERIADLQKQRHTARAAKNFILADRLRAEIESAGYVVNDQAITRKAPL